ncbi:MAG: GntR family transcriptional regulator [Anaerolineae bacterium]
MVDKLREDNRPLYLRAEEALRELIQSQYQPGDQLPPEPKLAAMLGISRATLREALRSFEERGLVKRRQGVGTFVAEHADNLVFESGLETLESLEKLAQRKGLQVQDAGLRITEITLSKELAEKLNLPAGTPAVEVVRTKMADKHPVAYMVDVVPAKYVTLEEMRAGFRGSVLDFLLERGTPALAYARARLIPMLAGREMAEALDVSPRTCVLLIEETLYSMENEPVEFSRNYFLPDFFNFHIIRRIGG